VPSGEKVIRRAFLFFRRPPNDADEQRKIRRDHKPIHREQTRGIGGTTGGEKGGK